MGVVMTAVHENIQTQPNFTHANHNTRTTNFTFLAKIEFMCTKAVCQALPTSLRL